MADPITFQASVAKVQTLADGGLRFTFDAGEGALMAMAELAACKQHGVYLEVVCTPAAVTGQNDDGEQPDNRKIHI